MTEFFSDLLRIVAPIFAISSMASVGLASRPKDIIDPLRDLRLVAAALLASFVLVPLVAWAVINLLSLDEPFETGLILVAVGAGAPFLIKFVQLAGGNLPLTAGILVLLLIFTIGYMPLVLPLALDDDVEVDTAVIAATLTLTMLAPLVLGLIIRSCSQDWAQRLRPILGPVSTAALVLLVASTVLANYEGILDIFGEGAILAALLVIGAAFCIGYLLGGRDEETRTVLGFATAQRNVAAATLVATQNFADDPDVIVMVVVTSLVAMAILFPTAFALRRHAAGAELEEALGSRWREFGRMSGAEKGIRAGSRMFRPHGAGRKE